MERVVAVVVRPIVVFLGVTFAAHLLVTVSAVFEERNESYLTWLSGLFPLDGAVADDLWNSLVLAAAGLVVATVLGVPLGMGTRSRRVGWLFNAATIPLMALAGPGLGYLLHRLLITPGYLPAGPGEGLSGDPWLAVQALVAPALLVGVIAAPGMAALITGRTPFSSPFGQAAAASTLASRSVDHTGWVIGLPVGHLACGLVLAETQFDRGGLFDLGTALLRTDAGRLLDTIAVLALLAALSGLLVDLIGLRTEPTGTPLPSAVRMAGLDDPRIGRTPLILTGLVAVVVVAAACYGTSLDGMTTDPSSALLGPLSPGHLLGTDQLGRDVFARSLHGLFRSLFFAVTPSAVATSSAFALALMWRRLPRSGRIVPGVAVDLAWWPLPVVLILAPLPLGARGGLLHTTVLAVVAIALVPQALRLARREEIAEQGAPLVRIAGIWLLVSGYAFLAHLTASVFGVDRAGAPSLGADITQASATMGSSSWPVLWPTLASCIGLATLLGLGSSLMTVGWRRAAAVATATIGADDDPTAGGDRYGPQRTNPLWLPDDRDRLDFWNESPAHVRRGQLA